MRKLQDDAPVVALAGGIGAARFLEGLSAVFPPERLLVIGNVGDDAEMHGLHVSPDLDTVMYTLAGMNDPVRGWGLGGETFRCLEALGKLGAETWFQLGDTDLATHIYRTRRLREGARLSAITRELSTALGIKAAIAPATDQRLRTVVETAGGDLDFQTWFVQRHTRDRVKAVRFEGAEKARPAPGVLDAIRQAAAVIVCPSNPLISVGPILAVRGIREALRRTNAPVVAISPIVGGRALKGPAARMMRSMGYPVSPAGVAGLYRDFTDIFVLDSVDAARARAVEACGVYPVVADTVMTDAAHKRALARAVLAEVGLELRSGGARTRRRPA
jgi:LPPG:FO 2-phospho-L-lactate transferase